MIRILVFIAAMFVSAAMWAAQPATTQKLPYDDKAEASYDIDAAVERAKHNNQRVLLNIGGNWCSWCLRLHKLFTTDEKVRSVLEANYQIVYIAAGRGDKNRDIILFYGLNLKQYPYLAVLDTDGNLVTQQDTGVFETKTAHDPEKVIAFLEKWKAPKPKE